MAKAYLVGSAYYEVALTNQRDEISGVVDILYVLDFEIDVIGYLDDERLLELLEKIQKYDEISKVLAAEKPD